jgi:apolipoprotein N-acyltransferase
MTRSGSRVAPGRAATWRVRAWPAWARLADAVLVASSRTVPPAVAIAWAFGVDFEVPRALAALIGLGLLPAVAALLLERAFRADASLAAGTLCIARDAMRVEAPLAALTAVVPWRIPLPGPGASLRLRSGGWLPAAIEPAPAGLLAALADAGVQVPSGPGLAYGAARSDVARRVWRHPFVMFGLFGMAPAAVLFRAHQIIAFGGLLGQYYQEGLRPYLATLVEYGGITLLYLVLFASTLRLFGEVAAFAATWIAPARARGIRAGAEAFCTIAYYAGVPALLALRFLT